MYLRRPVSHKLVKCSWKVGKKSEVPLGTLANQSFLQVFTPLSVLEDPDTICGICLTSWLKGLAGSTSCSQMHSGPSGSSLGMSLLWSPLNHPTPHHCHLPIPATPLARRSSGCDVCLVESVVGNKLVRIDLLSCLCR